MGVTDDLGDSAWWREGKSLAGMPQETELEIAWERAWSRADFSFPFSLRWEERQRVCLMIAFGSG